MSPKIVQTQAEKFLKKFAVGYSLSLPKIVITWKEEEKTLTNVNSDMTHPPWKKLNKKTFSSFWLPLMNHLMTTVFLEQPLASSRSAEDSSIVKSEDVGFSTRQGSPVGNTSSTD